MDTVAPALITLAFGLLAGWLARRAAVPDCRTALAATAAELETAQRALAAAQAELSAAYVEHAATEAREHALAEQLAAFREDRDHLTAEVKAASGDALKEAAADLARQTEEARKVAARELEEARKVAAREAEQMRLAADRQAKAEAAERKTALEGLVKPLQENLGKFQEKVDRLEGERQLAAGRFDEQLKTLATGVEALGRNADGLVTALRRPNVRGSWGELQLQTAFEHAGLVEGVNYTLQHTVAGDDGGRLRPDAVVKLPGGKSVVVDAKVPYAAFQDACEAADPAVAGEQLARHAQHVRAHVKTLASKEYQSALRTAAHATPDFVVMFIPNEAMYLAALQADPSLLEDAMRNRVLIVAPMTLIATLQSVSVGWQQERIAEDAQEIAEIARELHKRFAKFFEHVDGIGRALGTAVGKFNGAVGSFERQLVPHFRRLEDRGIRSSKPTPSLTPVDVEPRTITRALTVELEA